MDRGGVYWSSADGTDVRRIAQGLTGPNGIGLSPDGATLYAAETHTGRLLAWDVTAPGEVAGPHRIVVSTPNHFDSLAVEADGTVVVAAIQHGLCAVRPDGSLEYTTMPDFMTTNIAFGGPDLRTGYVTLSGAGRLARVEWPRPGLPSPTDRPRPVRRRPVGVSVGCVDERDSRRLVRRPRAAGAAALLGRQRLDRAPGPGRHGPRSSPGPHAAACGRRRPRLPRSAHPSRRPMARRGCRRRCPADGAAPGAAPAPAKSSHKGLWIVLAVVGLFFVLIIVAIAVARPARRQHRRHRHDRGEPADRARVELRRPGPRRHGDQGRLRRRRATTTARSPRAATSPSRASPLPCDRHRHRHDRRQTRHRERRRSHDTTSSTTSWR